MKLPPFYRGVLLMAPPCAVFWGVALWWWL